MRESSSASLAASASAAFRSSAVSGSASSSPGPLPPASCPQGGAVPSAWIGPPPPQRAGQGRPTDSRASPVFPQAGGKGTGGRVHRCQPPGLIWKTGNPKAAERGISCQGTDLGGGSCQHGSVEKSCNLRGGGGVAKPCVGLVLGVREGTWCLHGIAIQKPCGVSTKDLLGVN